MWIAEIDYKDQNKVKAWEPVDRGYILSGSKKNRNLASRSSKIVGIDDYGQDRVEFGQSEGRMIEGVDYWDQNKRKFGRPEGR